MVLGIKGALNNQKRDRQKFENTFGKYNDGDRYSQWKEETRTARVDRKEKIESTTNKVLSGIKDANAVFGENVEKKIESGKSYLNKLFGDKNKDKKIEAVQTITNQFKRK